MKTSNDENIDIPPSLALDDHHGGREIHKTQTEQDEEGQVQALEETEALVPFKKKLGVGNNDKKLVIKPFSFLNVVEQHRRELLAQYPRDIYQYSSPRDITEDSCVSSLTGARMDLPEIPSESMYPSPETVRLAFPERPPLLQGVPFPFSNGGLVLPFTPPPWPKEVPKTEESNATKPSAAAAAAAATATAGRGRIVPCTPSTFFHSIGMDNEGLQSDSKAARDSQHLSSAKTTAQESIKTKANDNAEEDTNKRSSLMALGKRHEYSHKGRVEENLVSFERRIQAKLANDAAVAADPKKDANVAPEKDIATHNEDEVEAEAGVPVIRPGISGEALESVERDVLTKMTATRMTNGTPRLDGGITHASSRAPSVRTVSSPAMVGKEPGVVSCMGDKDAKAKSLLSPTNTMALAGSHPPHHQEPTMAREESEGLASVGVGLALAESLNPNVGGGGDEEREVTSTTETPNDYEATLARVRDRALSASNHSVYSSQLWMDDSELARATRVSSEHTDLQVAEPFGDDDAQGHRHHAHGVKSDSKWCEFFLGSTATLKSLLQLGALVACVAILVVIVAVAVADDGANIDENDKSSNLANRDEEGTEIKIHLEAILGHDFFPKVNLDLIPVLPATAAWEWLVYQDPLQLNRTAPNLLQRFLMVYFYYSMTQEGPWKACNPPDHDELFDNDVGLCIYEGLLGDGTFGVPGYSVSFSQYDEVLAARWLTGDNECNWAGIFCDDRDHIEAIRLDDMSLNGTFPTALANLESLTALSLKNNNLSGNLPSELANLRRLSILDLEFNLFEGGLPSEWMELYSLAHINVGFNSLSLGAIPSSIKQLSNLEYLSLDSSKITGSFPGAIFELTNLRWLQLRRNEITGTLPTEVGLLHENLQMFSVALNRFTGKIPSEVGLLTSLLELDLWGSQFSGSIPEELYFSGMDYLNALILGENNLSGSISTNVARLPKLGYLLLTNNPLVTGTVPTELGLLDELERLNIHGTGMQGTIPDEVCALRGMSTLSKLKADCSPLPSTGEIPMVCPAQCCTQCCNQETGICEKTGS